MSDEEATKTIPQPPFLEKIIEGETPFDYWMRTLDVILDSNGTPQDILSNPNKTFPSYRWAEVLNNGYLAFWDSDYNGIEFVITDIGMTSENEKGWNGVNVHNRKKTDFLSNLLKNETDEAFKINLCRTLKMHSNFTENFMMFPISAKRMIVEIDPFFRFWNDFKYRYEMPALNDLTEVPNETLFRPNEVEYYLEQDGKVLKRHSKDKYIYEIKKLSREETQYCNLLFLDRIHTCVGFSSLNKIVSSIVKYKHRNSFPYIPRVDYTELYQLINERYQSSLDISTIQRLR